VQPVAAEAANLQQICEHPPAMTLGQGEADNAVCEQLSRIDGPFREKLNAMKSGLAHLDDVYKENEESRQICSRPLDGCNSSFTDSSFCECVPDNNREGESPESGRVASRGSGLSIESRPSGE
jgi:hypothetical protein